MLHWAKESVEKTTRAEHCYPVRIIQLKRKVSSLGQAKEERKNHKKEQVKVITKRQFNGKFERMAK